MGYTCSSISPEVLEVRIISTTIGISGILPVLTCTNCDIEIPIYLSGPDATRRGLNYRGLVYVDEMKTRLVEEFVKPLSNEMCPLRGRENFHSLDRSAATLLIRLRELQKP